MYSVGHTAQGRFYLQHPRQPGLAWSDDAQAWVPLALSGTPQAWDAVTFDSEEAADDFATENYLYPRRE